jgi:hypothetical protein
VNTVTVMEPLSQHSQHSQVTAEHLRCETGKRLEQQFLLDLSAHIVEHGHKIGPANAVLSSPDLEALRACVHNLTGGDTTVLASHGLSDGCVAWVQQHQPAY